MDTFSLVIDSLLKNDPVEARKHVRALMRSGTLAQEHWNAVYGTLRLTTLAIEGRGSYMYADTRKAWWNYYTAQALDELRTHLSANKAVQTSEDTSLGNLEDDSSTALVENFSPIIDLLIKNDPVAARKQLNLFMRSGKLPQKNWLQVHGVLLLITKAIDGRGDFMYADTRKAWRDYYTAQALEELYAYLGLNEVIQFPMTVTVEASGKAA